MAGNVTDKSSESDIVISSRVRLARNLKDFPFPFRMDREQGIGVLNRVKDSLMNNKSALSKDLLFVDIRSLTAIDRQAMVERHLISPNLAESRADCAAIVSRDNRISIMINEEDHLRIQCIYPGMQMDKAWECCNEIDRMLEEKVEFAFEPRRGYLTCCPTNVGTGIRASVMLHLPALAMTGYIGNVLDACSKLGVAVRGLYGEHSEALGNMFQVSNQVTLGQAEEEIIKHINNITSQIIEQERVLRNELYKQNSFRFEDRVFRSYGILSNARIISTEESLRLLSDVRLGVDMGIIKQTGKEMLNELMLLIQPAILQKTVGRPLSSEERDIHRADLLRGKLRPA